MENRPFLEPEERFSPEEQRRILELAARLQSSRPEGASAGELEAAAREVGIDSQFVREAIQRIRGKSEPDEMLIGPGLQILCAGFLFAQFYAVWGMLKNYWFSFVVGPGNYLWLAFALALALGIAFSGKRRANLIGLGLVGISTVVFAILIGGYLRLSTGQTGSDWPKWMFSFVLLEAAMYGIGYGIGRFGALVSKSAGSKMNEGRFP